MKRTSWIYRALRKGYLFFLDTLTTKRGVRVSISDTEVRLPGIYSRYFPKDYERENFIFLKEAFQPGMTAIDVGGHLGIYSVVMAKMGASRVYCFEPSPHTHKVLGKVIRLNLVEATVMLSSEAIAGKSGRAVFYLNRPLDNRDSMTIAEANSLKYIDHGTGIKKEEWVVNTITIDDFAEGLNTKMDFIKIDAEGAEMDVLSGAARVFEKQKPAGIISMHCFTYKDRQKILRELCAFMKQFNMKLLYNNNPVSDEEIVALSEKDIVDLQFTGAHSQILLA